MSDINIQRKSGSHMMWWMLGIVALVIVGWLLFANTDTNPQMGLLVEPGGAVAALATSMGIVS